MKKYYSTVVKTSYIALGINLFLSLLKVGIGIISNSIAIICDALHSFADLGTTLAIIVSIKISKKPPDKEHPFGHGRIEDISSLLIALFIFVSGIYFLIESIKRLFLPLSVHITYLFVVIIFLSAFAKLFLGKFTLKRARKVDSLILESDAFHHYSDFGTSLAVGVGLILVRRGILFVDAFLGLAISGLIILWSVRILRKTIDELLGKPAPSYIYNQIKEAIKHYPKVKGFHDLEVHSYGRNKIVSLHIELDKDLSLEEAHTIVDSLEKELALKDYLKKVVIHADLAGEEVTHKEEVAHLIKRLTKFIKPVKGFHRVKVFNIEKERILNFHLQLDKNISLEEAHKITHKMIDTLKKKFGFSQVNIHIEPFKPEGGERCS